MTRPAIILVAPQLGENIGATARAMLNFGIDDLRIVNPRDGWPNPKAEDMSKGAISVIENARIFESLADAAHDINRLYATTARPRDMVKPIITPEDCAQNIMQNAEAGEKSAIMFGPERSGLNNDDLTLCDSIVIIPVSEVYGSLNLAQAVVLMCYEYFKLNGDDIIKLEKNIHENDEVADKAELASMFCHLEQELDNSGFFRVEDKRKKMVYNIRNIFSRNELTTQEVRTLRGIIKSLTKR